MLERLRRAPVLRQLELGALDRLASRSALRALEPGTTLVGEDEPAEALYLVLEGRITVHKRSGPHETSVLGVRGAGDWVGESALLEGGRRGASVTTQSAARVLEVPAAVFLEAVIGNAEAILDLLRTLNTRQRESDTLLIDALRRKQDQLEASNRALRRENRRLRGALDADEPFAGFLGRSAAAERARTAAHRAAESDLPVLLLGETGTGKEILARGIHVASDRAERPFLALNCALFTEAVLESELFGHVRGAFTGAIADKPGLVEAANEGTLFLDEIADMPVALQGSLLRFLELGEFRRLGETRLRSARPRVVAATAVDLDEAIAQGRFRRDLLYRLDVVRIEIPPLRERPGDVAVLLTHLSRAVAARLGVEPLRFTPGALQALDRYAFPGNVRELANEVERLYVGRPGGDEVGAADLSRKVREAETGGADGYAGAVRRFKARLVEEALAETGGSQAEAARRLGMEPSNLSRLIRRLGISRPEVA